MRRSICWIMLLLLAAFTGVTETWAGGGQSAGEKVYTIKAGLHTPPSFPDTIAFERFKEIIEARSGGRIKVEIYADAVLGNETELPDQVSIGDIQMTSSGFLVNYDPLFGMVELPCLFDNLEHAWKFMTSPASEALKTRLVKSKNIRILAMST